MITAAILATVLTFGAQVGGAAAGRDTQAAEEIYQNFQLATAPLLTIYREDQAYRAQIMIIIYSPTEFFGDDLKPAYLIFSLFIDDFICEERDCHSEWRAALGRVALPDEHKPTPYDSYSTARGDRLMELMLSLADEGQTTTPETVLQHIPFEYYHSNHALCPAAQEQLARIPDSAWVTPIQRTYLEERLPDNFQRTSLFGPWTHNFIFDDDEPLTDIPEEYASPTSASDSLLAQEMFLPIGPPQISVWLNSLSNRVSFYGPALRNHVSEDAMSLLTVMETCWQPVDPSTPQ